MILQRTPGWVKVILAMLLTAVSMWLFSCYNDRNEKKQSALQKTADSLVIVVAARDSAYAIAQRNTVTAVQDRQAYTDHILAGNRPAIPRQEVVQLAGKCTEVENKCAAQKAAADALIGDLKRSLATEQKRVAFMPPRLRLGIESGWDFTRQAIPARGRAELRIAGPISLVGEAELIVPTDTVRLQHTLRALVRYEFR